MLETLTALILAKTTAYLGGCIVSAGLLWALKRTPNEKIKNFVGGIFFRLGKLLTLNLARWKYTRKYWNKIIEPWFIDLIDNIIGHGLKEFIRGLRADNSDS